MARHVGSLVVAKHRKTNVQFVINSIVLKILKYTIIRQLRLKNEVIIMDFDTYQKKAHSTAIYPKILVLKDPAKDERYCEIVGIELVDISWVYPLIGLAGEVGELANKMKKVIRDDNFMISKEKLIEIDSENGDIIWYDSEFCYRLKIPFGKSASNNLKKLFSRRRRKKVKGKGDKR